MLRHAFIALALLVALAIPDTAQASDIEVDLELILAVDVSGSMDEDEKLIQRRGYVAAFRHPQVIEAIQSGLIGRIAVTYYEWAGPGRQAPMTGWQMIDGAAAASAFADVLEAAPPSHMRGTSISGALEFGTPLFDANGFEGLRRVIDISGDGPNNGGRRVVVARDATLAKGITINGLPLLIRPGGYGYGRMSVDLATYYKDCVIGGPGAFVLPVRAIDEFPEAVRRKLILEIAGIMPALAEHPVPATGTPPTDCMIGEKLRRIWDDP